mmetsp:Transcript_28888/g.83439  ORF Transcript_28888/g.83439 Transcript_28888/m.83439 type:complete len:118 (-) Transcript_28888:75-428(-)
MRQTLTAARTVRVDGWTRPPPLYLCVPACPLVHVLLCAIDVCECLFNKCMCVREMGVTRCLPLCMCLSCPFIHPSHPIDIRMLHHGHPSIPTSIHPSICVWWCTALPLDGHISQCVT